MSEQSLSIELMCIQMRSGAEIWLEHERIGNVKKVLVNAVGHHFLEINDGQIINTADIVGIFTAPTMEELQRRKNGQWKCKGAKWHDRGEHCICPTIQEQEKAKQRDAAIAACGKCEKGFIYSDEVNAVRPCECIKNLIGNS